MSFVARSAFRATRLATMPRPPVVRQAVRASVRPFSVQLPQFKNEVIKETEIPVSVYTPDSKGVAGGNSDHFSIPVRTKAATPAPVVEAELDESVTPLDEHVYQKMPPTMQKMSVMGKVIIVTG